MKKQDKTFLNKISPIDAGAKAPLLEMEYLFLALLGLLFALLAFFFNSARDILDGNLVILTSPANLLTDYIRLSNIGASFFNTGMMTVISVVFLKTNKVAPSGAIVASVFTLLGFSFFGKNLFNTIPIVLGVYMYAQFAKRPFSEFALHFMFGTALSPLVSEVSFNLGLPLFWGLCLGVLSGMLAGFVIVPLSKHFFSFHNGLSLYNIGFTAGILGMLILAILRGFGVAIHPVSIVSSGNNLPFSILLFSLFFLFLLLGYFTKKQPLSHYAALLRSEGTAPSDYLKDFGASFTLINMGLMGIIAVSYVLLLGGEIDGPVLGGIFTVVGFSAYGKHLKNAVPILLGVLLANVFNIHEMHAPFTLAAALFGTTLAPIAGRYGFFAGLLAGFLHMSLVTNIGFLHAGINLYNNGFSGGFVAAFLYPLLEAWPKHVRRKKK